MLTVNLGGLCAAERGSSVPWSMQKLSYLKPEQFRVVKMKPPKRKDSETGKSANDKLTVIYHSSKQTTERHDADVNLARAEANASVFS